MKSPFVAQHTYSSIFEIQPEALARQGVRLLLADLDNTLAPYGVPEPTAEVQAWTRALERAGVTLFILSNNRGAHRASRFAQALGVPFIGSAGKPRTPSFFRAMEKMGCTPAETAIVGDQIFTDIWGGNRAGVATLLVKPIRLSGNPGRYLRYAVEWPFRALARKRSECL